MNPSKLMHGARALTTLLAVSALGALASNASAQERQLKLALQNPKGHPVVVGAEKFADAVTAGSNGRLKVTVYPGGSLGSDAQSVTGVQAGNIEFALLNSGILATQVKDFSAYDFPFMFANAREVDALVDGEFGKKLHAKLQDKGIVGLGYFELGFRNITNGRRAIRTVDDLAGLKLRVIPNPINVDWVKALGANPTPLAFTELFAALEQKAVDGQENPFSVILANRFAEVQKHLVVTNHQYNPQSLIVSKKLWDTLSDADKRLVQTSANDAAVFQRKLSRERAASDLEALKKAGMEVTELSPAELAKFREKMKPVIEKHSDQIQATVNEMSAELAKIRK